MQKWQERTNKWDKVKPERSKWKINNNICRTSQKRGKGKKKWTGRASKLTWSFLICSSQRTETKWWQIAASHELSRFYASPQRYRVARILDYAPGRRIALIRAVSFFAAPSLFFFSSTRQDRRFKRSRPFCTLKANVTARALHNHAGGSAKRKGELTLERKRQRILRKASGTFVPKRCLLMKRAAAGCAHYRELCCLGVWPSTKSLLAS